MNTRNRTLPERNIRKCHDRLSNALLQHISFVRTKNSDLWNKTAVFACNISTQEVGYMLPFQCKIKCIFWICIWRDLLLKLIHRNHLLSASPRTLEPPARAIPQCSFRFIPPDKPLDLAFVLSSRWSKPIISLTSLSTSPPSYLS